MSLVIVLMLHHPALLTLLALLPAINDHQEEPDEPMGFPAHDNYNIMANLAVVSSDLKADDPKVMPSLERLTEGTPAHLLILVFEDTESAVAESYIDWIMSQSQSSRFQIRVQRGSHQWLCSQP